MGFAFEHGVNDLEMVGLERAAGLSDFNDSVGERGRLDFCCAPTEFNLYVDAFGGEVTLADFDEFRSDDFAFEVFCAFKTAAFRHCEDPTNLAASLLGVGKRSDAGDIEAALDHPVDAGEAGVEYAVIDVARHLLGADEHALDFGIVDGGKVGAAVGVDVPAGPFEKSDGGILQAAFGDAESELIGHGIPLSDWVAGGLRRRGAAW